MNALLKAEYAANKTATKYEEIIKLVASESCNYERLRDLGEDRIDSWLTDEPEDCPGFRSDLQSMVIRDDDEWKFLTAQANGCESHEEAIKRIHDAVSAVEVRSGWNTIDQPMNAEQFRIIICAEDPAIQIRGELDDDKVPSRAWLEYHSHGRSWTHFANADEKTLLAFSLCFNFEE